jgi:UDP-glucose 4-epimerase
MTAPKRTVLVTGGAGYIGSHVVRLLLEMGERVVVVDDLSTGFRDRVPDAVHLERLDLAEPMAAHRLERLMDEHGVQTVMHFAAGKQVGDSIARPTHYVDQNVGGLTNLLFAMERAMVRELVFSSSAAVYGEPDSAMIHEDTMCRPVNPYGQTKLIGEWMAQNAHRAWGLSAVNLRYFNVGGAGWSDLRDRTAQNLVPIVIDAVRAGRAPTIFGGDLPTPDGSCIRDYIHVLDLAQAHIRAIAFLRAAPDGAGVRAFNLGTGQGSSVREVIRLVASSHGASVVPDVIEARAGDPVAVVADVSRASAELGWRAQFEIADIVRSAWDASVERGLELV